jgi:hypothetical protein
MKRTGVNYEVGIEFHRDYLSRPIFDAGVVHREPEVIRQDLHCNAIRISGTDIDRFMVPAEDTPKQGQEVWLSPHNGKKGHDYV